MVKFPIRGKSLSTPEIDSRPRRSRGESGKKFNLGWASVAAEALNFCSDPEEAETPPKQVDLEPRFSVPGAVLCVLRNVVVHVPPPPYAESWSATEPRNNSYGAPIALHILENSSAVIFCFPVTIQLTFCLDQPHFSAIKVCLMPCEIK